jgi:hypothetical protein
MQWTQMIFTISGIYLETLRQHVPSEHLDTE